MTDNTQPEALRRAQYLTVVYRDIKPGDEARELIMHPKMTASSWSHVMNERDRLAALVEAQHARIAELEAVGAGGVQALSAAPAEQSQPRYSHLHDADAVHGKRLSVYSKPPAEQAAPKAAPATQQAGELVSVPKTVFEKCEVALNRYSQAPTDYHNAVLRLRDSVRDLIAAAAPQQEAQEPAPSAAVFGWRLVPVEPTDQMVQAAHHIDLSYMPGQEGADRAAIYRALIAAAPQPAPAPLSDDVVKDAARYRWLRDFHHGDVQDELPYIAAGEGYDGAWALTGEDADKEIDAALTAQGGKE